MRLTISFRWVAVLAEQARARWIPLCRGSLYGLRGSIGPLLPGKDERSEPDNATERMKVDGPGADTLTEKGPLPVWNATSKQKGDCQ